MTRTFYNSCRFCCVLLATSIAFSTLQGQPGTDKQKLLQKSEEFKNRWESNRARVLEYSRAKGIPVRQETPDGRTLEIQLIENDRPVYYATDNSNAAK